MSRARRPWSLRRRLVVAIVALLAVVGVVVGTVSVLALRQNLIARLDTQLATVLQSLSQPGGVLPGITEDTGDGFRLTGTVVVVADPRGGVEGVHVAADGSLGRLTGPVQLRLLRVEPGGGAETMALGRLGPYRVDAVDRADGVRYIAGLSMADVNATTANLALIFGLVMIATIAAAAAIATLIVRTTLRPLGRVAATASRVAELPLATGAVSLAERVPEADTDPQTEVGQVGAAFNRMLDHVDEALQQRQASERKVRQFVADASHELRTPLASIRGYSELTRRSNEEVPPDLARSLARIESESIRMTALVEDLLLLARLDEGQELSLGTVDLVPLLADAVGDAHAAAPDHEWALDAPDHAVLVSGDASRLHQVVGNLLANAHRHTPAGTHVSVGLEERADAVVLAVSDDGPGVPQELQPTVFERFARGDASRSRAAGSTGLGLAIVKAVVEAHGGQIALESEPGRTVFTVTLPRDESTRAG